MGHARITSHVNAPIEHVWDLNASCERLPEWNVNVVEVKDQDPSAHRHHRHDDLIGVLRRHVDERHVVDLEVRRMQRRSLDRHPEHRRTRWR